MHYWLLKRIEKKLDYLIDLVKKEGRVEMAALDDLTTQVQTTIGIEASAVVLIQQLAAKIGQSNDPAMQALAAQLKTSADALAAAVAANPA